MRSVQCRGSAAEVQQPGARNRHTLSMQVADGAIFYPQPPRSPEIAGASWPATLRTAPQEIHGFPGAYPETIYI